MTCIIGYKDTQNDCVYMGADSIGVGGWSKTIRKDPKIFKYKDDIIIGFTSSYRMGQLLMYSDDLFSEIDILKGEEIDHKYMVTKFIPKIIQIFQENQYAKKINEEAIGGVFLIAVKNKLWKIESDYQVGETNDLYYACGCGEDIALGSLYSTEKNLDLTISEKIELALESAEKFSTGVQRPFIVYCTK